jgi:hypothetical protein
MFGKLSILKPPLPRSRLFFSEGHSWSATCQAVLRAPRWSIEVRNEHSNASKVCCFLQDRSPQIKSLARFSILYMIQRAKASALGHIHVVVSIALDAKPTGEFGMSLKAKHENP